MDHAGIEAVITLTPIGAPHEYERNFSLNLDTKQVDIGRASRNIAKGLTAAEDNAWFDSPIMSRQHAKFSLPSLWGNGIYLQDYGSTHGTFIGTRRLHPNVDYTINNGEVITFGVKITSGPLSYPAREFRVKLSWQPWSPAAQLLHSSPFKRGGSGFRVPDNEVDSASDRSREASVRIIDSRPRTYSVPSSDDSIESDEDVEINDASAVITPEHLAKKRQDSSDTESDYSDDDESMGSPGQGIKVTNTENRADETLGASQSNPIDLEGLSKHKHDVFELDREDEGPEVLPIGQSYVHSLRDVSATESFKDPKPSYCAPVDSFTPVKNHDNKYDGPPTPALGTVRNDIEGEAIAETQINYPGFQSPKCFLQGSIGDTTDDFDSMDEDDYDNDDEFLMEHQNYPEQVSTGRAYQRNDLPRFTTPKPRTTFSLPQSTPIEKFTRPTVVSYCRDIDVSQEIVKDCPTSQRPPSPSDAALAKKADSTDSRPKWLSTNDYPGPLISPTAGDASKHEDTPQPTYTHAWADNYPLNSSISAEPTSQNIWDEQETESTRYEDGPFAPKPKIDRFPLFLPHLSQQPWDPCTVPSPVQPQNYSTSGSKSFNMPVVGESKLRFGSTVPEVSTDSLDGFSSICEDLKVLHKVNEGQPSKVSISDLVNPYADVARNLKRKAEEISVDSAIQQPVSTDSGTFCSDDMKSLDVTLPDAQARDAPGVEVSLFQESTLYSVPDVDLSSEVTRIKDVDGPMRKRMRTTTSSVGGLAKFASGICVGVAGALAAFLATIPLSVREEALRELQSAA